MIRKVKDGRVSEGRFRSRLVPTHLSSHFSYSDDALVAMEEAQRTTPTCLESTLWDLSDTLGTFWWFQGEFYNADKSLQKEDVIALLLEKAIKTQRRIARATATVAQSASVSRVRMAIPQDVKMFVWQRDGGKCVQCGSNENLAFDHIVPISRGGSNTARNLQLLCDACNLDKADSI